MAKAGQTAKGNPAHKRMSNEKLKLRRAHSWARGQARKRALIAAQKAREAANKARRQNGELTPWEAVCAVRDGSRRGLQEMYAKRHREDALSAS